MEIAISGGFPYHKLAMVFWKRKKAPESSTDVLDTVADLKRDMRLLRLEWEDAYDKLLHLMRRLQKRDERAMVEPDQVPDARPPESYPGLAHLTPDQRKAQMQILARRQRVQTG